MTAFVIMEETTEITQHDTLPDAHTLPIYTYGYEVEAKEWYRVHQMAGVRVMEKKFWMLLDPTDKSEGVPKNIRAAVLILGG